MEPPVFVLPLSCWLKNCFGFQDWTYFSGRRKLLTTLNHKGPPYDEKSDFFPKVVLDSSKEASWCTECNAKDLSSLQCTVPEKITKTAKNTHFFKNAIFWSFFSRFIQERYIAESLGLLRCIQCTKTWLLSSWPLDKILTGPVHYRVTLDSLSDYPESWPSKVPGSDRERTF